MKTTYQSTPRTCVRCGIPNDQQTPGCSACYARHRARSQHQRAGQRPTADPGKPICPHCWRTAGRNLPACSIAPKTYGEPVEIINQWNPIFSLCTVCMSVREGTVPLDSPRVYLPVNPTSRRSSRTRIYPSRANPVLFLGATCTACGGTIDSAARQSGKRLCTQHYHRWKRASAQVIQKRERQNAIYTGNEPKTTAESHPHIPVDPGLAAFLAARRARQSAQAPHRTPARGRVQGTLTQHRQAVHAQGCPKRAA